MSVNSLGVSTVHCKVGRPVPSWLGEAPPVIQNWWADTKKASAEGPLLSPRARIFPLLMIGLVILIESRNHQGDGSLDTPGGGGIWSYWAVCEIIS